MAVFVAPSTLTSNVILKNIDEESGQTGGGYDRYIKTTPMYNEDGELVNVMQEVRLDSTIQGSIIDMQNKTITIKPYTKNSGYFVIDENIGESICINSKTKIKFSNDIKLDATPQDVMAGKVFIGNNNQVEVGELTPIDENFDEAKEITFDNTFSQLDAENVQDAIDEIVDSLNDLIVISTME